MKSLSKIATAIAPSATLGIDALAKSMKADGIDVIGFGAGEPDFNTPDNINLAAFKAIESGQTKYTPASGIMPLKESICALLKRVHNLDYEPSQICVSNGAKTIVFVLMQVLLDPGDEVIVPAPYWGSYTEIIRMAGGVPVVLDTDEKTNFKITPEQLRNAITDKTKALIISNPSNPTGMLYHGDELEEIARIIVEKDIYMVDDEIYSFLTYVGQFHSIAEFGADIKERTIIVSGVSKAYAMTGWRIGYAAANPDIAKRVASYLSHSAGCPCTVSQYAALEAYTGDQAACYEMKAAFDERRKYFLKRVAEIDGVSCLEPEGAFYMFMNIKPLLGRTMYGKPVNTSAEFASLLLEKGLVAVVPGSAFGTEGYLRWSYATSMENIKNGLDRFEKFIKEA
ncbi:MAG: pyridoxal phosphate-dependent aminotransferase [Oscillospiraceae bacterium]|nr:pyridoxal phosphate-dependent aminotransferase [Oscillospiraceae bacterium]